MDNVLRTQVVDGAVYFDLEQFLELMYQSAMNISVIATDTKDPALGIMNTGIVALCQSLDAVLTAKKDEHGLSDDRRCSTPGQHQRHKIMRERKLYWCSGLPERS